VQFVDLRFTSLDAPRDSTPLAGYVLLDPKLNVEDMSMNRPIVQDKVPATR
jgi:hypothetical protein